MIRRFGTTPLERMIAVLLLFESAMYSSVTPVLPHYARTLHASKPAIGLLTAGYPAGLIPGALLGGWLGARHGVRRTTIAGLVGFGLAIAGFGIAADLATLDLLRVAQGLFCGLIWGGGLTWLIAAVPASRRGAAIGAAIGAATFGTLLGPLLGTLAVTAGTVVVFCAVGAVALGLAAWARTHSDPGDCPPTGSVLQQLRASLGAGGFGLGAWLICLEAAFFGAASVLLPLRMAHFGAAGWEIGATFIGASALSTLLSPLVGRSVDRYGPAATSAVGLATGAPLVAALVLPHSATALGLLTVLALGAPLTAGMIPAVSLMTDATERAAVPLLLATTAINLGYAVGETIGAPAAAVISQAAGDALPLLIVAGLLLATLPLLRRHGRVRQRAALHTARASTEAPDRNPHGRDRRRADRPDRPSPVRVGTQVPPRPGDATGADRDRAVPAERP
jgi:MFS family permease